MDAVMKTGKQWEFDRNDLKENKNFDKKFIVPKLHKKKFKFDSFDDDDIRDYSLNFNVFKCEDTDSGRSSLAGFNILSEQQRYEDNKNVEIGLRTIKGNPKFAKKSFDTSSLKSAISTLDIFANDTDASTNTKQLFNEMTDVNNNHILTSSTDFNNLQTDCVQNEHNKSININVFDVQKHARKLKKLKNIKNILKEKSTFLKGIFYKDKGKQSTLSEYNNQKTSYNILHVGTSKDYLLPKSSVSCNASSPIFFQWRKLIRSISAGM